MRRLAITTLISGYTLKGNARCITNRSSCNTRSLLCLNNASKNSSLSTNNSIIDNLHRNDVRILSTLLIDWNSWYTLASWHFNCWNLGDTSNIELSVVPSLQCLDYVSIANIVPLACGSLRFTRCRLSQGIIAFLCLM